MSSARSLSIFLDFPKNQFLISSFLFLLFSLSFIILPCSNLYYVLLLALGFVLFLANLGVLFLAS